MTIAEAGKKYDLSVDTLRYYERIGLLPSVKRGRGGFPEYDEEACNWVYFIKCMRNAGITVEALTETEAVWEAASTTCVFVLFIAHNIINRAWYKTIFKGKYTLRRAVMAVCNAAPVFTFAAVLITGLLQSRAVLAFLHLPGGMFLRQIHTTAAYWGLLEIGVHLGLHWGMFVKGTRKMLGVNGENRACAIAAKVTAFLFASFGVWASFNRDMFAKLFLGFSFDYWDESRPMIKKTSTPHIEPEVHQLEGGKP